MNSPIRSYNSNIVCPITLRKNRIYMLVSVFVMLMWIALCITALTVMDATVDKAMFNFTENSVALVEKAFAAKADNYVMRLAKLGLSMPGDDKLLKAASQMMEENNGLPVYIADEYGRLRNVDGLHGRLRQTTILYAEQLGFSFCSMPDSPYMLLVIPLYKGQGYLARGVNEEWVANIIIGAIKDKSHNIGVYDSGNTLVADHLDDNVHRAYHSPLEYNKDNSRTAYRENGCYNFTIPLGQPLDWKVGVSLKASMVEPVPGYPGTIIMLITCTGVVLFVMHYISVLRRKQDTLYTSIRDEDQVTHLYNQQGMEREFANLVEQGKLSGYCMICADIIGFGHFNNLFGYEKGDMLLRTIADEVCIQYNAAARSHGDMFTIVAPFRDSICTELDRDIKQAIKQKLSQSSFQLVSFKYGLYRMGTGDVNYNEVQEKAMLALAKAKVETGAVHIHYDEKLQKKMDIIRGIERNMLKCIERDELIMYIQPLVDISGRHASCVCGEMLSRWKSPEMGFLSPGQFIPHFENNGFIVELDLHMLDKSFQIIEGWQEKYGSDCKLSVNLSRVSLTFPGYVERLQAVANRYDNVPNDRICIEVTESMLGGGTDKAMSTLHAMKKLGFSISLDDFGTGYSSLVQLQDMPIDTLKIDRGFLTELTRSERSKSIIKNVINLARDLSIGTVCEGVETKEQVEFVKQLGCTTVQGYYFSRPIPSDQFEEIYIKKKQLFVVQDNAKRYEKQGHKVFNLS